MRAMMGAFVRVGLFAVGIGFVLGQASSARAEGKEAEPKRVCTLTSGESPFEAFVSVPTGDGATVFFDVGGLDPGERWRGLGLERGEMTFLARQQGGQAGGGGLYDPKSGTTLEAKDTNAVMVFPGKIPAAATFVCASE